MAKKIMSLSLSQREMKIVEEMSERKGISKSALIRQAIRLFQSIDQRLETGDKLFLESPDKSEKSEIVVL